ncbi:MAG: hypothetical protein K2H86_04280 [Muribaculaceae bacterium]|nr:hypothetical protein [Muribaculaceae bacterium]
MFVENIYPSNSWYRQNPERNFDLVVLGSSSAKWAFDFTNSGIKAMNWAQQPQTLIEDYNLFRNFHSILRKGGVVLITVMPFTGLNKQTGLYDALKYLHVDAHEPIQPHLYRKAALISQIPLLLGLPALKALVKYCIGKDAPLKSNKNAMVNENHMDEAQLIQNALNYINGWKMQFGIKDLSNPLTPGNLKGREYRINLMRTIIDFCKERNYCPIFVIPPMTEYLKRHLTPEFEELYIYSFLREVNRDIPTLDYSRNETFRNPNLYFNSFFLNNRGRKLFTHQVLSDIASLDSSIISPSQRESLIAQTH